MTARTAASTRLTDCVSTISFQRSNRSTSTPPHTPKSSIGRNWRAVAVPIATGLPVSSSTSQSWATRCIQVPTTLIA